MLCGFHVHKEDFKKFVNERCEQEERSLLAHDSLKRPLQTAAEQSSSYSWAPIFSLAFSIELE